MSLPPEYMVRSHQKLRDLMKRDDYTWQTHPGDPARGMWVPPYAVMDWEHGHWVIPIEIEKPKEAA